MREFFKKIFYVSAVVIAIFVIYLGGRFGPEILSVSGGWFIVSLGRITGAIIFLVVYAFLLAIGELIFAKNQKYPPDNGWLSSNSKIPN